jgi:hypothetical protein
MSQTQRTLEHAQGSPPARGKKLASSLLFLSALHSRHNQGQRVMRHSLPQPSAATGSLCMLPISRISKTNSLHPCERGHLWVRREHGRDLQLCATKFNGGSEDDLGEGSSEVQNSLVDMLRLEIGKKQVKGEREERGAHSGDAALVGLRCAVRRRAGRVLYLAAALPTAASALSHTQQVEEHVEESSDKLKALADEAKLELDRLGELSKLKSDVAFDSVMVGGCGGSEWG